MPAIDQRPRWAIDDVLDRTDLASLLDELAQPSGRSGPGRKWHCPMPYHEDHRASVSMFRDRTGHERWRCWSGDHRGDAIDLVVAVTGKDRANAVDWLAGRAGMSPDRPLPPRPARPLPAAAALDMDPVVGQYVHACHRILHTATGAPVRDWLHQRGLDDVTITTNLIGCDPGRDMMRRQRGLPYGTTVAATLPVYGPAGNLTYVQARYLDPDVAGRKYDNPAAVLAPHPRLAFPVTAAVAHPGLVLICEGLPDALTATQSGFAAVGLLGAHTPDDGVAARLANHAANTDCQIVLVCDPDPAGRRVADVLAPMLAQHGQVASVVEPPDGYDLNDWAGNDPDWPNQLTNEVSGGRPEQAEVRLVTEAPSVEIGIDR